MREFVELQGASGANYRFRLWPGDNAHPPIAGNYVVVLDTAEGLVILEVNVSEDLSLVRTALKPSIRGPSRTPHLHPSQYLPGGQDRRTRGPRRRAKAAPVRPEAGRGGARRRRAEIPARIGPAPMDLFIGGGADDLWWLGPGVVRDYVARYAPGDRAGGCLPAQRPALAGGTADRRAAARRGEAINLIGHSWGAADAYAAAVAATRRGYGHRQPDHP